MELVEPLVGPRVDRVGARTHPYAGSRAPVPVAFIAGAGWSGSTLLEQALAQIDGCFSVGELYWLWRPYWSSMECECGRDFSACEFWREVLDDAYGTEQDDKIGRAHV